MVNPGIATGASNLQFMHHLATMIPPETLLKSAEERKNDFRPVNWALREQFSIGLRRS
jgi:hypothetical protein